jgi:bifunctional non-homologous end joining protein LigD
MAVLRAGQFLPPCLATGVADPPAGAEWLHEIKYDGYRVQAHIVDGRVTVFSRNGHDWTHNFGRLARELASLRVRELVVDGEAVVMLPSGVSDYHRLREELSKGEQGHIAMIAFDLLWLNGSDVRDRALVERKSMLKMFLARRREGGLLRFGDHICGEGAAIFQRASALGVEGIVSKRCNAPYRSGRSTDWLKIKIAETEDVVVLGYLDMKGSRDILGALVVGQIDGGTLRYAGRVGTGFSAREAAQIWEALQPLRASPPPLARRLERAQRQGIKWVEPRLVAEIEHRGWSPDGILRQAAFKRLRLDKELPDLASPA